MTTKPPSLHSDLQRDSLDLQQIREKIRSLHSRANRGLWYLALFLSVSILAFHDFSFLPALPEKVHALLGAPPPENLISLALVVYTFSAVILVLAKMMGESESRGGLQHVAFLVSFYAFYHFAGAMTENFWAVFASGVTILGLESFHTWNLHADLIRQEEVRFSRMRKRDEGTRSRSR